MTPPPTRTTVRDLPKLAKLVFVVSVAAVVIGVFAVVVALLAAVLIVLGHGVAAVWA